MTTATNTGGRGWTTQKPARSVGSSTCVSRKKTGASTACHREVLCVYEPKPDPRLAVFYGDHGAFVPLDSHSPGWLRNRLTGMATMFRRELPGRFNS
jgi:hypothetical protein